LRVAIVADFAEEGWPSMDLVADALFDRLRAEHADEMDVVLVRPPFQRRFTANSAARNRSSKTRFNADRLLNRFIDYPRRLRRLRDDFDVLHIIDHSYAHLTRQAGTRPAIVTCHDLDAFRPIIQPSRAMRAQLFRLMAAHQLRGLRGAAMVACASGATHDELLRHRLVSSDRVVTIPNGVAPVFSARPDPQADREAELVLGPPRSDSPEILHVGSTIARKRIDVLLRVFAGVREACRTARLVRVSGPFTTGQADLVCELGIGSATTVLPFVEPAVLAAIYRRAALVLITSDHEGFGLPLIEAMACGAPVLASDLAVLREVGGEAPDFVPVGDVPAWISTALRVIDERTNDPERFGARRFEGIDRAAKFSWSEYARRYVELYRQVVST
jgi:glycosyltransferase involved in cell wall biosynthesis